MNGDLKSGKICVYNGVDGPTVMISLNREAGLIDLIGFLKDSSKRKSSLLSCFDFDHPIKGFRVITGMKTQHNAVNSIQWNIVEDQYKYIIQKLFFLKNKRVGHYYFEGCFYQGVEHTLKISYRES